MAETLTIRTASSTEVVKIAVPGPQGATGAGVPTGGSTGQVLRKASGSDYDTEWAAAGAGSGSVTSVALASTDLTITGSPITTSGTITANIAANAVTLEKLQTISSEHLLGRHGSGNGGVQQIGLGTGLAMSGSNMRVATTGITAGTYTKLTIDETGRATVGATATPSDIGAQGAMLIDPTVILGATTLTAARAKEYRCVSSGTPYAITLPVADNQEGDLIVVRCVGFNGNITVGGSALLSASGQQVSFRYNNGVWQLLTIDAHTHAASAITSGTLAHERGGLEADVSAYNGLVKISGGSTSAVTVTSAGEALLDDADAAAQRTTLGLGTAATAATGDFAAASHSHGNLTNDGKIGSTAGLPVVTTTAGAVTTLALGTANQVLRVNSGATGVEFADPAASGVTGAAASASDVLGVSGANITGVDANADRIVYWNNTSNKLAYGTPADAGAAAASHTHAASDITSGTIDTARLASGTANSGTFLRGDQTWAAAGGVTTGSVDNAIIRADGTGGGTSQSSDINIEDATTSTANNVTISNQHSGQTNSSLVLQPKGTGAIIIGPKPDGTTTGGNARGTGSFDFVTNRSAATQVASGNNAFAFGYRCTASGNYAAAFGFASQATGEESFAAGQSTASNVGSVALGRGNASGIYGFSVGGTTTASGRGSAVFGENATAGGDYSFAFGTRSSASRHYQYSQASGRFSANGDVQNSRFVLFVKTTNATATEMTMDGTRLSIPSGRVMGMIINIVGAKSDGSAVAHYVREVCCKNVGGTSSLVGTVSTVGTDQEDNASTDVAITISDATDSVTISVTGIASETWRWVATVDCSEFAYGT